ncbi:MAG: SNF2-related protein, partial [Planctomycetota bacterium]
MSVPIGSLLRDTTLPELGFGRVLAQREDGRTQVQFSRQDEPRELFLEDHPEVVRLRLHPGQGVLLEEGPGLIGVIIGEGDFTSGGVWTYAVRVGGEQRSSVESELSPAPPTSEDPHARLVSYCWDPPSFFAARRGLLQTLSRWQENAMGTPAFLGARIHPLPHQIHAARKVLCDRVARFVLADEVGLGKTIEAGLVIQALQTANPALRVLVLAPGAMSRQWLCELFLRFGDQVYVHVDALRLQAEDPEPLLAAPRLIVSTTALESDPTFATRLLEASWDLVVVDEAHQIPPSHSLYPFLHRLAGQVPSLLALSATPSQRNEEGLLGLLALVAPDQYDIDDPQGFQARLAQHAEVTARIRRSADALEDPELSAQERLLVLASEWQDLLAEDAVVQALLRRMATGDAGAGEELLAYLQEVHALDRRIIRTRRSAVQAAGTALCRRQVEVLRYRAGPAEREVVDHIEGLAEGADLDRLQLGLRAIYRQASCTTPLVLLELLQARARVLIVGLPPSETPLDLFAALAGDPGPAEAEHLKERTLMETAPLPGEKEWLDEAIFLTKAWLVETPERCARFEATAQWISRRLRSKRGGKVLVFAQDRLEVIAFADTLREQMGVDAVGALHHAVDEGQVSELALRFQQPGGLRVLVSDDLGGDGRNFQIASALVHLNHPWSVSRVEQRVGRLDRMGRDPKRDVLSLVVAGPSPSEDALRGLHQDVFGVYERSLGGLEFLLPQLQQAVLRAACDGAAALEALRDPFRRQIEEERAQQDELAEETLAATRAQLEEAADHAKILAATDGADDVDSVRAWARVLGMKVTKHGDEQYMWRWTWEHLRRAPAGLYPGDDPPAEGRVNKRGTFSRYRALGNEALEFFAPGHPLIDALIRDGLRSTDGRASVFSCPLGPDRKGHVYLQALVRTELGPSAETASAGLRYRAHAHLWMQVRSVWVRLEPGGAPAATLIGDRRLTKKLDVHDEDSRARVDPDDLAGIIDPLRLWEAVDAGVSVAMSTFREERADEIRHAESALREEMRHDFSYLALQRERSEGAARQA